nr:SEC-C domain-containing protein [Anaerolineae bacterium]
MFKNLLNALAGNPYEREINRYREIVEEINALEPDMQSRSVDDLRALTESLKAHVHQALDGIDNPEERKAARRAVLEEILPEAFAAVREASVRTIGLRHFDVQMIGGIVLHEGKIAEMKTGEGKTLVASLPLYLNALTGEGAHLVTVNDYLARRDGGWMGPIFHLLGLSTGVIGKEQYSAIYDPGYVDPGGDLEDERLVHWRSTLRKECYQADITYGTAAEFGFDYLRDNTTVDPSRLVQREHIYVIVDEVDSVLIDGARTPLIISGPAGLPSSQYQRFAEIIEKSRLRRNTTDLEVEEPDGDYVYDDRTQSVSLTDRGTEKIERQLAEINLEAGESLYDPQYYELVHYLENALKAKYVFKRDKDYMVQNERVILIDQSTGRPMPSRRYSEGLHQAIEAKEGVQVRREDVTIATITVQNYFRMYSKLSGMTGTALTQSEEFDEVYGLDVIAIPTNVEYRANIGDLATQKGKVIDILPSLVSQDIDENVSMIGYLDPEKGDDPLFFKRVDFPDQVFQNINGKFEAVTREIAYTCESGRPVLVGTGSVEASEELSKKLKKIGLPHEILNAKNHQREALIIAQAGRPGAITISTSMAGRGTDILLGGNPEGLAAKYLADHLFDAGAFTQLVTEVIAGNEMAAHDLANSHPSMDSRLVEWVIAANVDLVRKSSVDDVLGTVTEEIRQDPAYSSLKYEVLGQIIQQIDLSNIDPGRLDRARKIAEEAGVPLSIIPDIHYRLNEYRSLSGLMGQQGLVDTLSRRLFEKHYNARAALIRAVLSNNLDEARRITEEIPALPATLIDAIQALRNDCRKDREAVWRKGGLHVIGTERHEARRIDDQLRGRAARQGDPGSSRFYLSLEDDLMLRFGGERTKRIMERLNIPEDIPIAANILSNAIEQSQSRFESYYFDIRKNLVEYDEAVNRQREIVYQERTAILTGDVSELDSLVRRFIEQGLERQIIRLRENYEAWAMDEIQTVMTDFSNFETGEVNTRGAVQRVLPLISRPSPEQLQALLEISDSDELVEQLHDLVLDGIEEGHNLRMLYAELNRIVPLWPVLPGVSAQGIEGWEAFVAHLQQAVERYAGYRRTDYPEASWETVSAALEKARRNFLASTASGAPLKTAQPLLQTDLSNILGEVFLVILNELETDELLEAILVRVDELLLAARRGSEGQGSPASSGDAAPPPDDLVYQAEQRLFGIGSEEMLRYERALMLSVIDAEWRQYLLAIDDLRQGVGLEAFGQRDPKIEFKRRAFEMFDKLREDVEEGIARRFFNEIPYHRRVIEAQQQQEQRLDNLARLGYRVERKVTQTREGQQRVAQTVHKDLWSNVGRNDPCPCGSGKKFKDCHYRQIQKQQDTVSQEQVRKGSSRRRRRR